MRVRSVALALVAGVVGGSAYAADVVRPIAPAVVPVVVAQPNPFGGLYVGLHGGWGVSDAPASYVDPWYNDNCGYYSGFGCAVQLNPKGAFVGGQIGVDFNHGNGLLFGIEGDWSAASLEDDKVGYFQGGNASTEVILKVDQMAVVQARLGIVHGNWLPYVTLGYGMAHTERSAHGRYIPDQFTSDTHTHTGLTYGAGLAYAINDKWSIFGEYRYFDGNTQNYDLAFADGTKTDLNIQTVRFGVNVKFH